jgi:hypothetical protein
MGHTQAIWGGIFAAIEAIGARDGEIERGVGCFTPNCQCRAHALDIAWPFKVWGGEYGGSVGGGFDNEVEGIVCRVRENKRGVGVSPKTTQAASISAWAGWIQARDV